MPALIFDRNDLSKSLHPLNEWKQVAFALAICERLYPNYVAFSEETTWGDTEKIRACLDIAWQCLSDRTLHLRRTEAASACEAAAPDTEDFQSKYTSAALDTALSTANLMRLLSSFDHEKVLEIAETAYETADLFTFSNVETAAIVTAEDERNSLSHPIVQGELRQQKQDIEQLSNLSGDFADNVELLRSKWLNRKRFGEQQS